MNYAAFRPSTSPPSSHPGYRTRPAHQVFPEDLDCVIQPANNTGAIYIGNLEAAQNLQTLRKHKIASLLTACKNVHIRHPKQHVAYSLYVPGQDHQNYDLSLHFETAADFIHQSLQETNILVHCMAGISRSVTLVIAYLIKYRKMSYLQALRAIQSRRNKINPNPGFVRQLQQYQQSVSKSGKKYYAEQEYENYAPMRESYFGKTRTNTYTSSNYTNLYASKDSELKFKSKYEDYSKYLSSSNLQVSKTRVANPQKQPAVDSKNYANQYQMRSSMQALLYNPSKTANQRRQQRNGTTLGQITNYPDYSTIRNTNIQDLSKDLDDRIAKIKQKYYQGREMQGSRNVNHSQQRRLSIEAVPLRNVKGRESFNSSGFNPFHAVRTMTYQYI